jgi:hypothetical protein
MRFDSFCMPVLALAGVLFVSYPANAQTISTPVLTPVGTPVLTPVATPAPILQTYCGPEVKAEIVKTLAAFDDLSADVPEDVAKEIYAKYQYCTLDAQAYPAPSNFLIAARECGAAVSNLGSLFYEEMSCAGYDPQRRLFAAPIKIKQTFGFGPTFFPGSREHVLHCVADPSGVYVPVARGSVHLSDAIPGSFPTWQFATIAPATWNLQTVLPLSGQTRSVRSILSWELPPTSCYYQPIWGDALNYRVRLDP